jgi:hypothetical protein
MENFRIKALKKFISSENKVIGTDLCIKTTNGEKVGTYFNNPEYLLSNQNHHQVGNVLTIELDDKPFLKELKQQALSLNLDTKDIQAVYRHLRQSDYNWYRIDYIQLPIELEENLVLIDKTTDSEQNLKQIITKCSMAGKYNTRILGKDNITDYNVVVINKFQEENREYVTIIKFNIKSNLLRIDAITTANTVEVQEFLTNTITNYK